jgi:ribosome-associated protein
MAHRTITASLLANEVIFTTSRSSGPGGQNVNKVNSKVTVRFDVASSAALTPDEKEILLKKLAPKLTTDGVLIIISQDNRSQLQNKEAAIAKLEKLLAKAFERKKIRKLTKPSKGSVQDRIQHKKQHSEKKKRRQRPME